MAKTYAPFRRLVDSDGNLITASNPFPVTSEHVGADPYTANVSMTTASTEYSYDLPANTIGYIIKPRSSKVDLNLSYTSGSSGTVYLTIPSGATYGENNISTTDTVSLYFQCSSASQTAEIIYWTSTN